MGYLGLIEVVGRETRRKEKTVKRESVNVINDVTEKEKKIEKMR